MTLRHKARFGEFTAVQFPKQAAPISWHDPQITGVLFSLWRNTFFPSSASKNIMCGMLRGFRSAWQRPEAFTHKAAGSLLQLQTGMFYYGDLSDCRGFVDYNTNTFDLPVKHIIIDCCSKISISFL